MTPALILFILRLVSALLLFSFLLLIFWYLYQDVQLARAVLAEQQRPGGHLRTVVTVEGGPAEGTMFPLLPVTTIGRDLSNVVVLDTPYVSGRHALLTRRGRQWWVEDQGSRNGTQLNGLPLAAPAVVSGGDLVGVGGVELKIELTPAEAPADEGDF